MTSVLTSHKADPWNMISQKSEQEQNLLSGDKETWFKFRVKLPNTYIIIYWISLMKQSMENIICRLNVNKTVVSFIPDRTDYIFLKTSRDTHSEYLS